MILTTCAVCAVPLTHEAPATCAKCETRYCGAACQRDHWRRGHEDNCETIARGGGAEQYNADKKYAEAVEVAVEECAEDTEGQTCYICLEDGSEEGLVRGCACRGASGFAHVSCLAKQAKLATDEADTQNAWDKWTTCGVCKQEHHGVVACALGWASWKTYVARPETDWARCRATTQLGNGLNEAGRDNEALAVRKLDLAALQRLKPNDQAHILVAQTNVANSYATLGQLEDTLRMEREIYTGTRAVFGELHVDTFMTINNLTYSLVLLHRVEEAKRWLSEHIPRAIEALGEDQVETLKLRMNLVDALSHDDAARDDLIKAEEVAADVLRRMARVLGPLHPLTKAPRDQLRSARAKLAALDANELEEAGAKPPEAKRQRTH